MNDTQTRNAWEDDDELSFGEFWKRVLVVIGLLTLVPAGLMLVAAMAFVMSPVAIVGIPFMLPVFFNAASEHEHQRYLGAELLAHTQRARARLAVRHP
jgi:hypothetical protein